MKNVSFEINPLDVNIAKIQHKLISNFDVEKFEPLIETFESKDPALDLSSLSVICRYCDDIGSVEVVVNLLNKNKTQNYEQVIFKSSKQSVFEYLNTTKYFTDVKSFVYKSIKRI